MSWWMIPVGVTVLCTLFWLYHFRVYMREPDPFNFSKVVIVVMGLSLLGVSGGSFLVAFLVSLFL